MFAPFKLRLTLSRDANVDLDDTLRTKKALKQVGYFETPEYGMTEYPDEPMYKGIEDFQRDNGLPLNKSKATLRYIFSKAYFVSRPP